MPLKRGIISRACSVRKGMNENQIVVYQPNETVRLDVRLENETVWLTQSQMATLFGSSADNIGLHLKKVYSVGELSREATTEDFSVVRKEGARQVRRPPYLCRRQDGRRNHPPVFSPQSARRRRNGGGTARGRNRRMDLAERRGCDILCA